MGDRPALFIGLRPAWGCVMAEKTRFALVDQVTPETTRDGKQADARCENCRYWGKGNGVTVCRLNPPVTAMAQGAAGVQFMALYPPTLAGDWCGQWKPEAVPAGFGAMGHGTITHS